MWLIFKKMKVLNRVIYNLQLYLHVYIKSTSSNDAWWVMTRRGLCGNQLKFHREEQWLCLVSLYHGSYLAKMHFYCSKYCVQFEIFVIGKGVFFLAPAISPGTWTTVLLISLHNRTSSSSQQSHKIQIGCKHKAPKAWQSEPNTKKVRRTTWRWRPHRTEREN